MRSGLSAFLLLGIFTGFAARALAQECPTPVVEGESLTIQLSTVKLKLRPGPMTTDLELTQISPITGEVEIQRKTIIVDAPPSEQSAVLQVNQYEFDRENLTIKSEIVAVLAAGYTASGTLNIGYGAKEGGFLVLIDGAQASTACLSYPANAAFGDWTDAISIVSFDPRDITAAFRGLKEELRECRSQNSTLSTQGTSLGATNAALRERIRVLEAELAKEQEASRRRIFDLSRVIRSIFNEAQAGVKTRYPGARVALSVLRKQLVLARKANRRNIQGSSNVVRPNRNNVNR